MFHFIFLTMFKCSSIRYKTISNHTLHSVFNLPQLCKDAICEVRDSCKNYHTDEPIPIEGVIEHDGHLTREPCSFKLELQDSDIKWSTRPLTDDKYASNLHYTNK
jgi:hypothetical protein